MAVGNIPGIVLLAGATVLLILASISTPVLHDFTYLKAQFSGVSFGGSTEGSSTLTFGLWGACITTPSGRSCTKEALGYGLNLSILNLSDDTHLAQTLLRGVAKALILVPIAAGISFIALIFALSTNVVLDILASAVALLAFFVTLIAFILSSVVFITARHRLRDLSGVSASLQNCYWFLLAALLADLLASCFVLFGCFKRRRSRSRDAPAANGADPMMTEKRHWWARNRNTAVV